MTKRVAVLGGGIVGVCAALEAQKAGFDVVLIDRKSPGEKRLSAMPVCCQNHLLLS